MSLFGLKSRFKDGVSEVGLDLIGRELADFEVGGDFFGSKVNFVEFGFHFVLLGFDFLRFEAKLGFANSAAEFLEVV